MARAKCVCGCQRPGHHGHHVVTQAVIRRHAPKGEMGRWLKDKRNIVPVDFDHHLAHHNASRRLWLDVLPDSVFEFALELMGAGPAYEYLARTYRSVELDPRLAALLAEA